MPDIGAELTSSGLAWAFIKYSTDYSALEKTPRAKRIGIWQSKTQPVPGQALAYITPSGSANESA